MNTNGYALHETLRPKTSGPQTFICFPACLFADGGCGVSAGSA